MSDPIRDKVDIVGDRLEVHDFSMTDLPTVSYLSTFEDKKRAGALKNCIQLGARVSQFASDRIGATEICERIEAAAASAKSLLSGISDATTKRIDTTIEAVFGNDGKGGAFQHHVNAQLANLQRELEGKLDPEKTSSITQKIRDAIRRDVNGVLVEVRKELNLADPTSPLGLLRNELDRKHKQLDERITQIITQETVKTAVGIERVKGTQKGVKFEDALHPVLDRLSRPRHDSVERTGTEAGFVGNRLRGDFVVEVNPKDAGGSGLRIVIEAKNDHKRLRDLMRELDEAKENRVAQVAIGISTNAGLLAPDSPPIIFPSEDKVVVCVPDYDERDGTFDALHVEVALEVARFLAVAMRKGQARTFDLLKVDERVAQAINVLTRLTEVKKRLTSIANTAKETDTLLETIRSEVRTALKAVRDAIADELVSAVEPTTTQNEAA